MSTAQLCTSQTHTLRWAGVDGFTAGHLRQTMQRCLPGCSTQIVNSNQSLVTSCVVSGAHLERWASRVLMTVQRLTASIVGESNQRSGARSSKTRTCRLHVVCDTQV